MADCEVCGQPITGTAYVCADEAATLGRQLHAAADLVPELDTALTRQTRFTDPGPRPRNSAPAQPIRLGLVADPATDHVLGPASGLPFSESVSIATGSVDNVVSTWCRVVTGQRGIEHPSERGAAMRWLAGQLEWTRHQQFAAQAFDELGYACRLIVRAVDRPARRVDAGLCLAELDDGGTCQQRLTAGPAAAYVHCPACRTTHSAVNRRQVILAGARQLRANAAEVAAWLTILGMPTPEATIRKWGQRRRLLADPYGRYHFGSAVDLRLALGSRLARSAA
jgi:hypothetical protein